MSFKTVSEQEDLIARKIVDAVYTVHRKLGPALLESVYEVCFCHEPSKRGLRYQRQGDIPIVYSLSNLSALVSWRLNSHL